MNGQAYVSTRSNKGIDFFSNYASKALQKERVRALKLSLTYL